MGPGVDDGCSMLRICRNMLRAGLAFGLMAGFATGALAQFSDDEFVFGETTPVVKPVARVPLPSRKPAKPSQFAAEAALVPESSATASHETGSGTGLPVKKPMPVALATIMHEAGPEVEVAALAKQPAPEALATVVHETGTEAGATNPDPDATAEHEQRAVDSEESKLTPREREQSAVSGPRNPKTRSNVAAGRAAANVDTKPTGAIAPRKSQAEQKQARRTIDVPARRPPKPRKDPAATKRQKAPQPGTRKTREQQCASLTICRQAFAKCRFSKEREKLDEDGWEVHKKYCGDIYQKCISSRFGEGELFFTRWFLPYDPCS